VLAAERDDSELVCDSLTYVEPVQPGVQQPRHAPVELVGTGISSVQFARINVVLSAKHFRTTTQ